MHVVLVRFSLDSPVLDNESEVRQAQVRVAQPRRHRLRARRPFYY